ncbi:MAG: molecular chaperone DnaJ [Pseudomonadota bacterium]|nr:molecular chaperone DnaJ [Pseudomonadota bacterium]
MSKSDYYDVLGITKNSSSDEIKKAYRKNAMKFHPDRNQGDKAAEKKFKDINEAYEILKDDQKRAAYDQFGHSAFEQGMGPGASPGGFDFGGGLGDIFDAMFGDSMGSSNRRSSQPSRGQDQRVNLEISLEDAFNGKKLPINFPTSTLCSKCSGSGSKPGYSPENCSTCNGYGKVRTQKGFFTVERTCPSCRGEGSVIKDPCRTCSGSGVIQKKKTLEVNIPKGVENGTRMRLSGEGEAGLKGGPPGDLYIFLSVKSHQLFQRDGSDIFLKVPISMPVAALGGEVEVPSIDGKKVRVTIPKGCQSNHQFRLRGKGMNVLNSKMRGDMFIETIVEVPINLTGRQKQLLEEFEKESQRRTYSPKTQAFFDNIKGFFKDISE